MDAEQIKYRCELVEKHCVYSSPPSRCQRAHRGTSVVEAYYTLYPEGHYFDDDAMRFFNSRLGDCVHIPGVAYLFITSEKPPHGPRAYTVRIMPTDFNSVVAGKMVDTVGQFQQYRTRSQAQSGLKRAVAQARHNMKHLMENLKTCRCAFSSDYEYSHATV